MCNLITMTKTRQRKMRVLWVGTTYVVNLPRAATQSEYPIGILRISSDSHNNHNGRNVSNI